MKAWRVETHGGNEVLKWIDVPTPKPGPMEVLVKVEALGLNHLDVWVRKGVPGHKFPLPLTPGCDSAGTIAEFGPGSENALATAPATIPGAPPIALGSRVLVSPGISCGRCEACLGGFDPLCPRYGILGETRDGGAGEYVCVPATNLIPLPPALDAATAAALPIPFLTAWTMVFRKLALKPGETILVQAAGSGVSMAAIQLAKMVGATVITTVGDDAKIAGARALGADHVIQYRKTPFREELKKILKPLGKKGVECAIDHVGADTFEESVKALAWGGRLACCGATTGSEVKLDLKVLFFKNLALHGATMGSKADLLRVVELVAAKKLAPVIHSRMKMGDLPAAMSLLEERKAFGKIVLTN